MTERLKGIFSTRVAALPDATRKLLLLAVLDGSGELHVLQRALGAPDGLAGLSPPSVPDSSRSAAAPAGWSSGTR